MYLHFGKIKVEFRPRITQMKLKYAFTSIAERMKNAVKRRCNHQCTCYNVIECLIMLPCVSYYVHLRYSIIICSLPKTALYIWPEHKHCPRACIILDAWIIWWGVAKSRQLSKSTENASLVVRSGWLGWGCLWAWALLLTIMIGQTRDGVVPGVTLNRRSTWEKRVS